MIWRNDDISYETNLIRLKQIHGLFIKYKVQHTIALMCEDIHMNPSLITYINGWGFDVQIHCYRHYDLTTNIAQSIKDLQRCISIIQKRFNRTPTVLYPPWNKSSSELDQAAVTLGLTVSNKKISISQYLRGVQGDVINFHSWSDECNELEAALIKYTSCA